MEILKVINNKLCNGCGACVNKCPKNAISMEENNEGFLYPVIDTTKCVNCKMCDKVCSYINNSSDNSTRPDCYLFVADDEVRKTSSSGGAFPTLAKHFIQNDGYVCGAIWDDNRKVKHIVTNKMEDIERLKTSKYIQSNTKNCYKEIEKLLKSKKAVLFTGTPCQVSALKNFLGKNYDKLYTMDLICHGVPSPKVLYKFLDENFDLPNLEKISFRNKVPDGCRVRFSAKVNNEWTKYENSDFMDLFSNNVIIRNSCGSCVHNKLPRQGDITLGDFWEIGKYGKCVKDNLGISVVLNNKNSKSNFLIKILKSQAKIMKKTPLSAATKRNINIYKSSTLHKNRQQFFDNLDKISIKENTLRTLKDKCDCMILNFWSSMNYGAILVSLGVQSLMEKLELNSKIINYTDNLRLDSIEGSFCQEFANKYLNLTNPVKTWEDFVELNRHCDTFITGSDQIFNTDIMISHTTKDLTPFIYCLDFVKNNKKKLSYAGSFGTDTFKGTKEFETLFKHYLTQLDYVSVREQEGKKILDNWEVESEVLIDAVFHIPYEKLEEMTAPYNDFYGAEKYIAYFTLPYSKGAKNLWKTKIANKVSKRLGIPLKTISINENISVEQWLAFIKNAEFVISDSYHSIVFAIRFNKNFIQLIRDNEKNCRFTTLYKALGLKNTGVSGYGDCENIDHCFTEIDWNSINNKIQEGVKYAQSKIKTVIETNKSCINSLSLDSTNLSLAQNILLKRKLPILLNKDTIKKKYRKYKLMQIITLGKSKKRYKQKYQEYKKYMSLIRREYKEYLKF